jgi:hypothetical protein
VRGAWRGNLVRLGTFGRRRDGGSGKVAEGGLNPYIDSYLPGAQG